MVRLKRQKVRFRKKRAFFNQKRVIRFKDVVKFLTAVLFLGAIGMGVVGLKYMFMDSEYFVVKKLDVELSDANFLRNFSISSLGGEKIEGVNIWFVNLEEVKKKVAQAYPDFKDVVVRRVLPHKLIVYATQRKAIVQIRSDRYYLMDEEGVLLPEVKNFPVQGIPIITGVGINLAKASALKFSEFEKERIDKALTIIKEMSLNPALSKYKIKVIDIVDPGNLSFFLELANVEIKIGNSDFRKRLELLATVLGQVDSEIDRFKYIDLRFEDPIVGPR